MQIRNKKIVLTGGCGFIGNNFIDHLIEKEPSDILVIDKLSYVSNTDKVDYYGIPYLKAEIESYAAYQNVINYKPDIIINMAAESHVDVSIENPNLFLDSNVYGTVNLLNAAKDLNNTPLFLQISTDEVYGSVSSPSVESDGMFPSSPYSASKASAEQFVHAYHTTFKVPFLITRSSNNYGPFQHQEKLIPKAITNILNGVKIPIYGNGKNIRNWIYVDDNCKGIINVLESNKTNEIYNVSSNDIFSNLEIISYICKVMNKDIYSSIEFVEDRKGHDLMYYLSNKKLIKDTPWKQETSIIKGLEKTINWYSSKC